MTEHTPGPWTFVENGPAFDLYTDNQEERFCILLGMQGQPTDQHRANTELIAAAPDTAAERDSLKAADLVLRLKLANSLVECDNLKIRLEETWMPESENVKLLNDKTASLKAINAELVAALLNTRSLVRLKFGNTDETANAAIAQANAAIAKAKKSGS